MSEIRVRAVQLWSDKARTPDENRAHAISMAEAAAAREYTDDAAARCDLIVMPEAVAMLCYPDDHPDFTYRDVADTIPGPTVDAFCDIARNHHVNVVVGLVEDRGADAGCQNVALVINRSGDIIGKYEKLHEPAICRHEQAASVGEDIPIFELDFGRIGIMVCWDLIAPELASVLELKGAELLCVPHLIGLPTTRNWNVTLRARAIDTGLPVVAAGMRDPHNHNGCQDGLCPTCILNPDGEVLAQVLDAGAGVAEATIDLSGRSAVRRRVLSSREDRRFDVFARAFSELRDRST